MEDKKAAPGCWMTFMFAVMMWIFVLDSLGVFTINDRLLIGSLFLIMYPVWVKGADLYYKCDDAVMGHFYMVFGITFAGLVGIGYVVLFFSHAIPGWAMDERFFGVIYLVGGVFLIPTVPSLMYMDKVNMVTWSLCTVWLINGGIYYFYYSIILYWINIICCCLVAVGVTYMMLNEAYLMSYGRPLPMGRPLKEE